MDATYRLQTKAERMPQRILHASTVCTHASTYREDANTWSALGNRCRHMSTSIPGRPHHHRLPAPTATSRATGGLMLHSRGVPIARISLSCAIAPTSDYASPPPPAPPQTPSAPATAPPPPTTPPLIACPRRCRASVLRVRPTNFIFHRQRRHRPCRRRRTRMLRADPGGGSHVRGRRALRRRDRRHSRRRTRGT